VIATGLPAFTTWFDWAVWVKSALVRAAIPNAATAIPATSHDLQVGGAIRRGIGGSSEPPGDFAAVRWRYRYAQCVSGLFRRSANFSFTAQSRFRAAPPRARIDPETQSGR
jgi:hypothetical protein